MSNSLRCFYIFPIDTRHIPDTYPTHTPYIRISHEYAVNTPRIICEYPIGTSIIPHPKSPASNVGERTCCLFCRYHSLSLCARGVVRAQMLLDYVLISPEGSNDRFAYVIVVDISSLWHCQLSIVNYQFPLPLRSWRCASAKVVGLCCLGC